MTEAIAQHPIPQRPARLLEAPEGLGPDDAVSNQRAALLKQAHGLVDVVVELERCGVAHHGELEQAKAGETVTHLHHRRSMITPAIEGSHRSGSEELGELGEQSGLGLGTDDLLDEFAAAVDVERGNRGDP